jgi:hypothetical protein
MDGISRTPGAYRDYSHGFRMDIRRVVGMQNGYTSYNGRPHRTASSGVCSLNSRDGVWLT